MKMAKPSAKDIAAAEELQQVLNALDQNQRWGCAALEDTPDFFQLIDDDEFDPEQGRHAQALYNKLVTLMWENPSFHNRVISGMCHVIMYEKNEIIDPDSDCIDLHPRLAEMWNDLKRETQAARYWNKRYHQVVAELDGAQAKLAAMESQELIGYASDTTIRRMGTNGYRCANICNSQSENFCIPVFIKPLQAGKPAVAVPDGCVVLPNRLTSDLLSAAKSVRVRCYARDFNGNPVFISLTDAEISDLFNAFLSAAPSHSQQRCSIGQPTSHDAEIQVTIDHNGKCFGVDESISEFVTLLNSVGLETVASCSGHGHRPANIALKDGREIIIARDYEEARKIDRIFPVDINGDTLPIHENNQQSTSYSPSTSHEPVWDMFGLTYASWLVWPRVIMQAMDLDWQRKFVALAVELNKRFPDWEPKGSFHVGLRVNGKMQKLPEELCNYRRPADKYRRALTEIGQGHETEQGDAV